MAPINTEKANTQPDREREDMLPNKLPMLQPDASLAP